MTRWLKAANMASVAGTKLTKLTEPPSDAVLSEESALSKTRNSLTPYPTMVRDGGSQDLAFYASRFAWLADPDGVARTREAIDVVWDWAEALAKQSGQTSKDIQ